MSTKSYRIILVRTDDESDEDEKVIHYNCLELRDVELVEALFRFRGVDIPKDFRMRHPKTNHENGGRFDIHAG